MNGRMAPCMTTITGMVISLMMGSILNQRTKTVFRSGTDIAVVREIRGLKGAASLLCWGVRPYINVVVIPIYIPDESQGSQQLTKNVKITNF